MIPTAPNQQVFLEHLKELRTRLFRSVLVLVFFAIVGLVFCKQIYHFLQIPMLKVLPPGSSFIVTGPFESYMAYFKVSLLAGLFMASPFIFYQIWSFVAPGLKQQEKKFVLPFSIMSAILFVSGSLFGYFVVFPAGFYYVNLILDDTAIKMMPQMSDYLSVASTMLIAFGVTFELPLFIFLLGKIGLLDYKTIKAYRRYVIVVLFIVAAVLTPGPDILSQCLLAIPLWVLYELGGLSLLFFKKKNS